MLTLLLSAVPDKSRPGHRGTVLTLLLSAIPDKSRSGHRHGLVSFILKTTMRWRAIACQRLDRHWLAFDLDTCCVKVTINKA